MKNDQYNSFRNLEGEKQNSPEMDLESGRVEIDFSSRHWLMERMNPGEGEKQGLHLLQSELSGNNFSWIPAKVPGDVYTDLYLAGEIDDPFYDRNMGRSKWVQYYEWWYNYSFNVPLALKGKKSTLYFGGVDYSCDVYLNKEKLGHHEGMFSSFSFDVSDKLIYKNSHTPDNLLTIKLDPPPKNQKNFAGMKHNFAGDYLPGLIPFGIWKGIKLILTDKGRILNSRVETQILEAPHGEKARVKVTVSGEVALDFTPTDKMSLQTFVRLKRQGEVYESSSALKDNTFSAEFVIDQASLWWPYEMGCQNRYKLEIALKEGETLLDNTESLVGLREIKREKNPGFTDEEAEKKWTFVINTKKMFLRSACWGGQPSIFYGRNNREKYRYFLEKAKEAHINNLRIFGWHPPESEDFYEICDEIGLTVWTNFPFATQVFSEDPLYLEKVYKETAEIVKDRRNHASNIMWMGGEEVYFSEAHVESGNKALMLKLGALTNALTSVPYEDASPLSSREGIKLGYKPKESVHANSHYYAAGAIFMEDYYPKLDACIIPELTAASSPNIESLKKFIKPEDLWPAGFGWGYHAGNMDLLTTLNYEVFGNKYTDSLEHFVKASQIAQGTIFQFALEHFRREKPRVSGVALCHFITNWPMVKWDIIDYYGKKKISYDFVKRAYNPLLPSLKYKKRRYCPHEEFSALLYVVNDYQKEYKNLTYEVNIYHIEEQACGPLDTTYSYLLDAVSTKPTNISNSVFEKKLHIEVGSNSSECFGTIKWNVEGNMGEAFFITLKLIDTNTGEIVSSNAYTILIADQEKALRVAHNMYENGRCLRKEFGRGYYRYTPEKIAQYEV